MLTKKQRESVEVELGLLEDEISETRDAKESAEDALWRVTTQVRGDDVLMRQREAATAARAAVEAIGALLINLETRENMLRSTLREVW